MTHGSFFYKDSNKLINKLSPNGSFKKYQKNVFDNTSKSANQLTFSD
jgi:hypothetical protein